jgi:hypothetical protein
MIGWRHRVGMELGFHLLRRAGYGEGLISEVELQRLSP